MNQTTPLEFAVRQGADAMTRFPTDSYEDKERRAPESGVERGRASERVFADRRHVRARRREGGILSAFQERGLLVIDVSAIFAPLPTVPGGFACILADVPSRFRSNSVARPGRNALRHYACHSMETIATLPVGEVAAGDSYLFFWTTGPLLSIGAHIPVIRAWGFEPTAMGFVWIKLNPKASPILFTEDDLFFGPGLTTRKNAEFVILCRRSHPERIAKDVFEIILAPRRESGRKPGEAYRRIERYCAGLASICSAARAATAGASMATSRASSMHRPAHSLLPALEAAT
jgi:N6-adenosine-specific RNA methylase IME4